MAFHMARPEASSMSTRWFASQYMPTPPAMVIKSDLMPSLEEGTTAIFAGSEIVFQFLRVE